MVFKDGTCSLFQDGILYSTLVFSLKKSGQGFDIQIVTITKHNFHNPLTLDNDDTEQKLFQYLS